MATAPTVFVDDDQVSARAVEVPNAAWDDGCNIAGSNAPGLGINYLGGAVVGTAQQFTLLDQTDTVRDPQKSAQVGYEDGNAIRAFTNDASGDGSGTFIESCSLEDIAVGWVAFTP